MPSFATALGLHATDSLAAPNRAPFFVLFHFIFAYVVLAPRPAKIYLKLDHNVSPREDLTKYGDAAVKSGKISQRQLNFLKRNEACHANSMEHFPVLVAAVVMAILAGLPNETLNRACVWYTAARLVYAVSYLTAEDRASSMVRSVAWWVGNGTCIRLLWLSGKAMSGGR